MISDSVFYQDSVLRIGLQNYRQTYSNMAMHKHSFLTISLLLKGCLVECSGDRKDMVQAGSLSIKPAGIFHSDIFTTDCTILSMNIMDWDYYQLDFSSWEWQHRSQALKYFLKVIQQKDKKAALQELKQFILDQNNQVKTQIPIWLIQIHDVLNKHFKESLPVNQLAKEVGVHPVHLGRSFRQHFGMDIKSYQRHLRLHYAMSEAMNNKQNLTQIAYDCGFSDQSHFSREFKKVMDISPRQALIRTDV